VELGEGAAELDATEADRRPPALAAPPRACLGQAAVASPGETSGDPPGEPFALDHSLDLATFAAAAAAAAVAES
jgi:hypothetical protein